MQDHPHTRADWKDSDATFESLLNADQHGCVASQGKLLEPYRKYLKSLARVQIHRSLTAKGDASDLVQEVFLRACEELTEFYEVTVGDPMVVAWGAVGRS